MGGLPVILVGVRHTRIHGKKGERPCSFFFMPKTPRYQMQNRASTVWCAEFHGATVEDFLEVFGGKNCVIQGCFNHGGRGVQLWNSFRYLEFSCAVCAAMDRGDENGGISEDVGNHYIRAVALMTGWFIHQAGMTAKTARPAEFVQRDAMGTTVSTEWQLGLARFLNEGPDSVQGSSGPRRSRSQVASKGGHYSCLMGSCGHGCGTPHCDADGCMQCTMLSMVWEGFEKRTGIESAMRAPTPTPWHMVPRLHTRPDLCLFNKAASPEVKGRFQGKSDWQVVQELVAPHAAVLYPKQAEKQYERDGPAPWMQPFDMPMAHVKVGRAGCSPMDTEVVVFVPREDEDW